jgi:diamine N-acetyltransferase
MNAVRLRALEPADLEFLMAIENNRTFWKVSETVMPYSEYLLSKYIEEAHLDIYATKQFRFVIENISTKTAVGLIDLYDFDPKNSRAGVGVVIDEHAQGMGFAREAILQLISHAKEHLLLFQLYAKIQQSNGRSVRLFQNAGFQQTGKLSHWYFNGKNYEDEIVMQCFINF